MKLNCVIVCASLSLLFVMEGAVAAQVEEPQVRIEADVVYGHKDGLALTMDIYRPASEANGGSILFMVSGGWYSRWAPPREIQPFFQPYLEQGYTVLAVRHGSSPRYSIPEAVQDVRRAVRYVRKNADQLSLDADRLGVMGMSAGGHLALMLGTTGDDGEAARGAIDVDSLATVSSRVAAVVALVPPTDLRVCVWESAESLPAYKGFPALNLATEKAAENSPLVHVTPDDAPALVIMGANDELVPPRHGQWIDEAFKRDNVEHKLIVLAGAGHGLQGEGNQEAMIREVIQWFDRHLKPDPK